MSFRNSQPPKRAEQPRRISARYLVLRYTNTASQFDALEIRRLAYKETAQCTISRGIQADGLASYLAFVDFCGKRFQTRNTKLFDVQGHHPEWFQVPSSPWKAYDFCVSHGEVLVSDAMRPPVPGGTRQLGDMDQWDVLASSNRGNSLSEACSEQVPYEIGKMVDYVVDNVENTPSASDTTQPTPSQDIDSWKNGFEVGFSAGLNAGLKMSIPKTKATGSSNQLFGSVPANSRPSLTVGGVHAGNDLSVDTLDVSSFPMLSDHMSVAGSLPWD